MEQDPSLVDQIDVITDALQIGRYVGCDEDAPLFVPGEIVPEYIQYLGPCFYVQSCGRLVKDKDITYSFLYTFSIEGTVPFW
ncbi:hypothetical protein [Mobilibacterium timonense]|uniref:hypothetical protein n=1 Tax=Mobilibacterium timonense TaxID=1871012 RepID=UPI00118434DC|nr:hypothetical protein [Mobilibacterium timonense]